MQQVCSSLFFIFPSLHEAQVLSYPLPSCVTIRDSFSRYFIYSAYLLCTSLPLSPQASVTFLTVPTPFSHAPSSQPLLPCECYTNPCVILVFFLYFPILYSRFGLVISLYRDMWRAVYVLSLVMNCHGISLVLILLFVRFLQLHLSSASLAALLVFFFSGVKEVLTKLHETDNNN